MISLNSFFFTCHSSNLLHFNLSKQPASDFLTKEEKMVRAAHLLIKHTGSRNPVSRRTNEEVILSPEQAHAELQHYEQKIIQEGIHEAFPKYCNLRSDCSSYKQSGDLGDFDRGMMQKPFEDASFALEPGQMSSIVSTDSGFHLIYRIS